MLSNKMNFQKASDKYSQLFRGKPDEARSTLLNGCWHLQNRGGDLLAVVYPDGSVLSGRIAAELFRW